MNLSQKLMKTIDEGIKISNLGSERSSGYYYKIASTFKKITGRYKGTMSVHDNKSVNYRVVIFQNLLIIIGWDKKSNITDRDELPKLGEVRYYIPYTGAAPKEGDITFKGNGFYLRGEKFIKADDNWTSIKDLMAAISPATESI